MQVDQSLAAGQALTHSIWQQQVEQHGLAGLVGKHVPSLRRQFFDHPTFAWIEAKAQELGLDPEQQQAFSLITDAWMFEAAKDSDVKQHILPLLRQEHSSFAGIDDNALLALWRACAPAFLNNIKRGLTPRTPASPSLPADHTLAPETMRAILEAHYGHRIINVLESAGKLNIVASVNELPAAIRYENSANLPYIAGITTGQNEIYMVANRIGADQVAGLFLHEVGEHAGLAHMLGEDYGRLSAQFRRLLRKGDTYATWAAMRVPSSTPSHHVPSEQLAYLVERVANDQAARPGGEGGYELGHQCLSKLRTWLFRTPLCRWLDEIGALEDLNLSPADLASLAREAVDHFTKQIDPLIEPIHSNEWNSHLDTAELERLFSATSSDRILSLATAPAHQLAGYLFALASTNAPHIGETIEHFESTLAEMTSGIHGDDLRMIAGEVMALGRAQFTQNEVRNQIARAGFALWMDDTSSVSKAQLRFLTPSADGSGVWQISHYQRDLGSYRSEAFESLDVALQTVNASSFSVPDSEASQVLQQWSKTFVKPDQVKDSKAFQQWFQGSRAVSESGEALVLYHGTGADFSVFDAGFAFWASATPELANEYAEYRGEYGNGAAAIMPVYMQVKRPFEADRLTERSMTISTFFKEVARQAQTYRQTYNADEAILLVNHLRVCARREESGPYYTHQDFWNNPAMLFGRDGATTIKSLFTMMGFDSIIFNERGHLTYGVFDSTQIKSAVGNIGTFNSAVPDIRFAFGGELGADLNLESLDVAQIMLAQGDDSETIRQATGWFTGIDGKWRFEIDDSQAELVDDGWYRNGEIDGFPVESLSGSLGDQLITLNPYAAAQLGYSQKLSPGLLKHPKLFSLYPGLASLEVKVFRSEGFNYASSGSYEPHKNLLTVNINPSLGGSALSVVLHEVQHAIQRIEGFARGGNVEMFDALPESEVFAARLREVLDLDDLSKQNNVSPLYFAENAAYSAEFVERIRYWQSNGEWDFVVETAADRLLSPVEKYRRLAGEVEARNVQTRQRLTEAERKNISPEATQDIPSEAVYLWKNGVATSVDALEAIGLSQTKTDAFKIWFGQSQAIDEHGSPLVLYHGTAADFDAFDPAFNRSGLNEDYQGDGFHFTPSVEVAAKYADAARNNVLNQRRIFEAAEAAWPQSVTSIFKDIVKKGFKAAWAGRQRSEVSEILADAEKAGIDINDVTDLAPYVEGAHHDNVEEPDIFGTSAHYLPEHIRETAVSLNVEIALPNPTIVPVYLRAEKVLRTDDRHEAKAARSLGYDAVYYTGEGTVDGVPEWIVFDPVQIKSAVGNNGAFDPKNNDIRFAFAGEKAVSAPLELLAQAKVMHSQAADSADIWATTGWSIGMDGRWRFEIDDSTATLHSNRLHSLSFTGEDSFFISSVTYRRRVDGTFDLVLAREQAQSPADLLSFYSVSEHRLASFLPSDVIEQIKQDRGEESVIGSIEEIFDAKEIATTFMFTGLKTLPLSEVLDHPALYEAYPQLKTMPVSVNQALEFGGSLSLIHGQWHITLGTRSQLDTLIHEIQHAIQEIENFAKGGSVRNIRNVVYPELESRIEQQDRLIERYQNERSDIVRVILDHLSDTDKQRLLLNPKLTEWLYEAFGGSADEDFWESTISNLPQYCDAADLSSVAADLYANILAVNKRLNEAYRLSSGYREQLHRLEYQGSQETYMRLPGEIEARNASHRRLLTADARKSLTPEQTQDRPVSDAFMVWHGNEAPLYQHDRLSLHDRAVISPSHTNSSRFSFAGPRALSAERSSLLKAKERHASGESAQAIRQVTGWFLGADDKWRFEIDDSKANARESLALLDQDRQECFVRLGEVLDHPLLFEAYPHFKAMEVLVSHELPEGYASYNFHEPTPLRLFSSLKHGQTRLDERQLSALLHEIQHAIQNYEGFGYGGMPDEMPSELYSFEDEMLINALEHDIDRLIDEKDLEQVDLLQTTLNIGEGNAALKAYRRLSGEVEARNVEARMHMSAEERISTDPFVTQDVQDDDLIPWGPFKAYSYPNHIDREEFRAWFGTSKVTQPNGWPLIVYHGTGADFTTFDAATRGDNTGAADAREGFFFTTSGRDASEYAWKGGEPGQVMPVYLSIANPYTTDFLVTPSNQREFAEIVRQAKALGHDGVQARLDTFGRESDVYVAFEPTQIKSAFGNFGTFDSKDPDIRYSFAGVNARNAPLLALADARLRLELGEKAESVWQATGWLHGSDGKWRFEIDDSAASVLTATPLRANGEAVQLDQVIDHPILFNAYPELRSITVSLDMTLSDGAYYPDERHISLGAESPSQQGISDKQLSALLHEMQHAIQSSEAFATGGSNKDSTLTDNETILRRINRQFSLEKESAEKSQEYQEFVTARLNSFPAAERYRNGRNGLYDYAEVVAKNEAYDRFIQPIEDKRLSKIDKILALIGPLEPLSGRTVAYWHLAGEVEARNTQARRSFSIEARRAVAPALTEDVDAEDVIVRIPELEETQSEAVIAWNGKDIKSVSLGAQTLKITDTPEFKAWFQNSKIVKANGELLVAYHGTDVSFSAFRSGVAYFTPRHDYSYIQHSPIVMPVYLAVQNPYRPSNKSEIEQIRSNPARIAELEALGYDGILWSKASDIMRGASGWGDDYPQIVTFRPEQVKSAIGNAGSFSASSTDIRFSFSELGQTATPEFKAWFGKSHALDHNGEPKVFYHGTYAGEIDTFDRMKSAERRRISMDTVGIWFSDRPGDTGAGMYANGVGASIYPVYLRAERTKYYDRFDDFLRDMHESEGREFENQSPKGVGSTEGLRTRLKAQGYDSIGFTRTDNGTLEQEVFEAAEAVRRAKDEEFSVPRAEREFYTIKRLQLEERLTRLREEQSYLGYSTELDGQNVLVVFEPEQIKSAIGNNGDFSRTNTDIRFSLNEPPRPTVTDSAAFKRWFDGSKLTDTKGSPLKLYHGTNADITMFDANRIGSETDAGWLGRGFYFSTEKKVAESYGDRLLEVYLSIKKPLVLEGPILAPGTLERHFGVDTLAEAQRLVSDQYDGVIFKYPDGELEVAAFRPEQIKSATANNGEFDPTNPDIRFQLTNHLRLPITDRPAFKQWFGASKVVDNQGAPKKVYHGTGRDFSLFSKAAIGTAADEARDATGAFWFSDSITVADSFARLSNSPLLMPMYLKMNNPLVVECEQWAQRYDTLDEAFRFADQSLAYNIRYFKNSAIALAKQQGCDGVIFEGGYDGVPVKGAVVYAAFEPGQMKSALGNLGNFNRLHNDILFNADSAPQSVSFDQWFEGSHVTNAQGRPLLVYRGEHGIRDKGVEAVFQSRLGSLSFGDFDTALLYATEPNDYRDNVYEPRVIPAYLTIKSPILVTEDPYIDFSTLITALGYEKALQVAISLKDAITETQAWHDLQTGEELEPYLAQNPEALGSLYALTYQVLDRHLVVEWLKQAGFDGAIYGGSGANTGKVEYRVFHPSQVLNGAPMPALHSSRFNSAGPVSLRLPQTHETFGGASTPRNHFSIQPNSSVNMTYGFGRYLSQRVLDQQADSLCLLVKNCFRGEPLTLHRIKQIMSDPKSPSSLKAFLEASRAGLLKGQHIEVLVRDHMRQCHTLIADLESDLAAAMRGEERPLSARTYSQQIREIKSDLGWLINNAQHFEQSRQKSVPYEDFLYWHKPLEEQSQSVRDALALLTGRNDSLSNTKTGEAIYGALTVLIGTPEQTSKKLLELGVLGVCYTPSSASAGDAFVVFQQSLERTQTTQSGWVTFERQRGRLSKSPSVDLDELPGVSLRGSLDLIKQGLQATHEQVIESLGVKATSLQQRALWLTKSKSAASGLLERNSHALNQAEAEIASLQSWIKPSEENCLRWDRPVSLATLGRLKQILQVDTEHRPSGKEVFGHLCQAFGGHKKACEVLTNVGVIGAFTQKGAVLWDEQNALLARKAELTKQESNRFHIAYHGTPHVVDRFSNERIGTGEGAQAYGWGLYFAQLKTVAAHYQQMNSRTAVWYENRRFDSPESLADEIVPAVAARYPKLASLDSKSDIATVLRYFIQVKCGSAGQLNDVMARYPAEICEAARHTLDGIRTAHPKEQSEYFLMPVAGARSLNDVDSQDDRAYRLGQFHLEAGLNWIFHPSMDERTLAETLAKHIASVTDVDSYEAQREAVVVELLKKPHDEYLQSRLRDTEHWLSMARYASQYVQCYGPFTVTPPLGTGNLYMVDIDIREEEYLSDDKPYSEQTLFVREKLRELTDDEQLHVSLREELLKAMQNDYAGSDIYSLITSTLEHDTPLMNQDEAASRLLLAYGIQGIIYADRGSRQNDKQTFNYVVFDDSRIKILGGTSKVIQTETDEFPLYKPKTFSEPSDFSSRDRFSL